MLQLRYFTPSHAEEYLIPAPELRAASPSTSPLNNSSISASQSQFVSNTMVKLDFKGRYGVSIVWSDGHFADIISFDVLKAIAIKLKA